MSAAATEHQLELELDPVTEPVYETGLSWAEKFEVFHAANPHVARALENLAAQWLAYHPKVAVKALVEVLRWNYGIKTRGEAMALNNSFTAYYARLLVRRRPEWSDAIDMRRSQADNLPDG